MRIEKYPSWIFKVGSHDEIVMPDDITGTKFKYFFNIITIAIISFLNPQVITPWRLPEFYDRFKGRKDLFDYAEVNITLLYKVTFLFLSTCVCKMSKVSNL